MEIDVAAVAATPAAAGSSAEDSNLCLFGRRGGGGGMRMESMSLVMTIAAVLEESGWSERMGGDLLIIYPFSVLTYRYNTVLSQNNVVG